MKGIIAVAQRHATCFMISRHNDKRLVRMIFIELIRHLHGLVHIPYFADSGRCIVTVTSIVNHTAFHHHEETVVARIQERDCGADDLFQTQVSLLAVDGVREI